MNRSILIVICDFLLVTLVAFSNFDAEHPQPSRERAVASVSKESRNADLVGTLKLALEDEKQTREKLSTDLQSTRENLRAQEQALAERESKIKEYQEDLRRAEEQARQIEQQRSQLAQQVATAQTSVQDLQKKLAAANTDNQLSRAMLDALQADLSKREQEAKTLQQKMGELEKSQQAALAEKQQITTQLQVSEAEKRLTRDQVVAMREEKAKLQEHATKLVENIGSLAQKSGELTQEIRENRPLAPNAVFHEFMSNRITAKFEATRVGLFGRDVDKDKTSQTILISDGSQNYALFHVEDTPLLLWNPGTDWRRLTAVLARGNAAFAGVRITFLAQDPRVVVIPIGEAQAKQLGAKIYKVAPDPFKFQDAIIVGAMEGYYGECKFQIDLATPQYVKVDRSLIRGMFGKFNPSRGDLVLSRTGEVLGIMVNAEYCAVLNKIVPTRTIQLGNEIASQQTGQLLAQLYERVFQMPQKLK